MTREEFQELPYLLTLGEVVACGYAVATINKYAAHKILAAIKPKGCTQRRFQKVQLAAMLGWADEIDRKRWAREKPLLGMAAVLEWTGYTSETFCAIVKAGGIGRVQPGGIGHAKYRKEEVGEWVGL